MVRMFPTRYSLYPSIGDNVDVSVSSIYLQANKGSASVFKMLIVDKSGQAVETAFDFIKWCSFKWSTVK